MNPFREKAVALEKLFMDWEDLSPKPYDKREVDPYTRTRIILMNGTEYEQVWFTHQMARHVEDGDLKRQLALIRRGEQQQQKLIAALKPADETLLEHTLGYEQLAVDLTAALAKREKDGNVKRALDFALLEDFDHVYRYADLMDLETGEKAETVLGGFTEIMPGRPTISEHRFPYDDVKKPIVNKKADPQTRLNVAIITAAEQQTMNYYMNVCAAYPTEPGRRLYREIGMIEEQHVTQYESLMDPKASYLECLLNHEYVECYLYYSCRETETDERIRRIWERLLYQEISHLHSAAELLEHIEGKDWRQVLGDGEFPDPLALGSNIDYVRDVLGGTVQLTALRESWASVDDLGEDADFHKYQKSVNHDIGRVQSHAVIKEHIDKAGEDYRFETVPEPVYALRDHTVDNTDVGRTPGSV